jgi:hypothetical protein
VCGFASQHMPLNIISRSQHRTYKLFPSTCMSYPPSLGPRLLLPQAAGPMVVNPPCAAKTFSVAQSVVR